MSAAQARGCVLGQVDCDGNPHAIVANWLEEGVNIMFPIEIGAGSDPAAWRKEFGKAVVSLFRALRPRLGDITAGNQALAHPMRRGNTCADPGPAAELA